jgi:hypothetical protein
LLRINYYYKKENLGRKKCTKYQTYYFNYHQQLTQNPFNKKIEDFYKDKFKSELCRIKENNSGKLRIYSKNFGDFELQRYLKLNRGR